jgi:hypothetical protein
MFRLYKTGIIGSEMLKKNYVSLVMDNLQLQNYVHFSSFITFLSRLWLFCKSKHVANYICYNKELPSERIAFLLLRVI